MRQTINISLAILLLGSSSLRSEGEASSSPVSDRAPPSLTVKVGQMEDAFLAQLETSAEPEGTFDQYEVQLKKLIAENPDQPGPFNGLMELLEKCETPRARRLIDEVLRRESLPEKVRVAYQDLRDKVNLVGRPVPLAFTALDGSQVRFDDYRGKVVVLDFWATWCGPCVRDLPKLQSLYDQRQRDGLVVVGVSFDREQGKLASFLRERAIPWPQIYPNKEERETIARELHVTGGYLPTVFLIGKDGRLRHTLNSRFQMAEKVAALLKE